MTGPFLIGMDVGTTSVKGALFDERGRAVKTLSAHYPTHRPSDRHAEQNPDDWMKLLLRMLASLSEGLDGQISAIGLTSQVNTHVFVDGRGEALYPAITWQDGRADLQAASLNDQVSEADRIAWWGAPLPIDASHILARMDWMRQHHPDIWQRTRHVLAPKDYCIQQLTGAVVADPMASFGTINGRLDYIDALINLVPGAKARLAPLHSFTDVADPVRPGLPCAGVPVVTGTMDAWAGLYGTGTLQSGDAMYLSGTSEIVGLVSPERVPTPGIIAFPDYQGITMHAGPTQSGGASLAWLAHLLGRTPSELSHLAATADQHKTVPMFLPHLQGERAPIWDMAARGAFAGLDASMGAPELVRSVMEGVAFSVRWLLSSLEHSANCKVKILNAAGGGMGSDIWCQIRADILGKPIRRLRSLDAGVLGAAILAGVGTGQFSSVQSAAEALVQTDRIFEPRQTLAAHYDTGFERYKMLYQDLKGFNAGLR